MILGQNAHKPSEAGAIMLPKRPTKRNNRIYMNLF
jgi:hypothetical protein